MHSMSDLPFLKKKINQQGGGGPIEVTAHTKDSNTLLEHIADELLTAIEKKDIKSLREALQALIMNITDTEE